MNWLPILLVAGGLLLFVFAPVIGLRPGRRCVHPFDRLAVEREAEVRPSKTDPEDCEIVEYYLYCRACGAMLSMRHARYKGDVRQFFGLNCGRRDNG